MKYKIKQQAVKEALSGDIQKAIQTMFKYIGSYKRNPFKSKRGE